MKLPRILLWIVASIAILIVLIRLLLPALVELAITDWFEQQSIDTTIEDISFEISNGEFQITGLKATAKEIELLNLDSALVGWSWSDLFNSDVKFSRILLDGLELAIEQQDDGNLVIAGIDLAQLSTESKTEQDSSTKEPIDWHIYLDELALSNFDICYRQSEFDYCSRFKALNWRGDLNLDLSQIDSAPLPLFARGKFGIEAFQLHNKLLARDLVNFNQLNLDDIDIDSLDSIRVSQISLTPLTLLTRSKDELSPQISRVESILLTDLKLDALQQLSINQAQITDHELLLINKLDNSLEFNEWLEDSNNKASENINAETENPFHYAINQLIYRSGKSIRYQDNSLESPFIVDLNNISIKLDNLDSSRPDQDSQIDYSAQYSTHGKLSLNGTARPLAEKPSFNLSGNITGLDLRDISPFLKESIGHTIKSGQLDADLKLAAEQSQLDSKIDLKLYHFELTAQDPQAEEKINTSFGFPLNSSLSLLKDSDNTIELSIPVTGDLKSPDFDPNDAIRQATSSAITSAIISYYTPFGLVMVVEGLIDLATALDFEAIRFTAGTADLDGEARSSLGKLTKLLNERPGIHLTLCSISNSADRLKLLPETAEIPVDQLKLEVEQLNKLVELGETRAANVKQYLVDQKIDASRLVLCTAEHKEGDGLSAVNVSI